MREKKRAEPTPGPWEQSGTLIYATEGTICELSELRKSRYIQHERLEIGSPYWDEQMANAALIATAPDLLALCKELLNQDSNNGCGCELASCTICSPNKLLGRIRAAVAKVEGEK